MAKLTAGALSRFVQREYGGLFQLAETQIAVGVASLIGAGQDPDRIALFIVNTGTTNITVSSKPVAVSGQGILLLGNGASVSLKAFDDGDSVGLQWNVVSDLAGGSVQVFETRMIAQTEQDQGGL